MKFRIPLPALILALTPAAVCLLIILSIRYGAKDMTAATVWSALFQFDPERIDHQIIVTSRLPRVVGTLLIGAFLAVSGALMQGMTRNYLASPSILGISDGSVFAVTLFMIFLPEGVPVSLIACSILGSAASFAIVFGIARLVPDGMSPVRLAILGTVIGLFLSGVAEALAAYFQISQSVAFWYNARLHRMDPELIRLAIPIAIVGLSLAIGLSRFVTVLSFGDEVSAGLGIRTALTKTLVMLSVVLLTGVSVAIAGKIAFVGLIVPHIARMLSGSDYRWIVPVSGALGALFLAACDIIARFLNAPFETPIGVVTALFGVPFFLYLIKTRGGKGHA
ncbi:iron ABC transporter permease [Paenibacillus sp. TRM 82003]|nr:iron ABC transporter permease [Paenibacillus sp. TRM 82003]